MPQDPEYHVIDSPQAALEFFETIGMHTTAGVNLNEIPQLNEASKLMLSPHEVRDLGNLVNDLIQEVKKLEILDDISAN